MALCAGRKDFSQTGGVSGLSTIVLLNRSDFISGCSDEHFENNYLPNYYPSVNRSRQKKAMTALQFDTETVEQTRLRATLQHAFSQNCSNGEIWSPEGECTAVTEEFMNGLPDGVEPGSDSALRQCTRFNSQQGAATCKSTDSGEACAWTWQGFTCEQGNPPGVLHQRACSYSTLDQIGDSCHIWEETFSQKHPVVNCLIPEYCEHAINCLNLASHLALTIGSSTSYEANETATRSAISSGLSTALGVDSVKILQIRGWSVDWDEVETLLGPPSASSQQVQNSGGVLDSFWEDTEPILDNSSITLVKFVVTSLPVTLLPSSIPGTAATLAAQIDRELGNGTVVSVQFTPWPPFFATTDDVAIKMNALVEAYRANSGNSGPPGPR